MVDWKDGDAFRQDGELGRKANLKGKINGVFLFVCLLL